jgi:hypothetical protein
MYYVQRNSEVHVVTYTPSSRQRALNEQLYDQLLQSNDYNNSRCWDGSSAAVEVMFYVASDLRFYLEGPRVSSVNQGSRM